MGKKIKKVYITRAENDRLWEDENLNRAVEECEKKFDYDLWTLIIGFAEELVKLKDAASLIALSKILDDISREVEEMVEERG